MILSIENEEGKNLLTSPIDFSSLLQHSIKGIFTIEMKMEEKLG
jgi:hypothetical protein